MREKCDGRVTRADGTWLPCSLEMGHSIREGWGCTVMFGEADPVWNPRDTERRKGERRATAAQYAPLVEAVREYQRARTAREANATCSQQFLDKALDALAALPLPENEP